MQKNRFHLILILYFFTLALPAYGNICPMRDPELKVASPNEILDELAQANWLAIGASRFEDSIDSIDFYFDLVMERSERNKQCLFVLADAKQFPQPLDTCNKRNIHPESIFDFTCNDQKFTLDGAPYVVAAIQTGYSVYAIDDVQGCEEFEEQSPQEIVCRNENMAKTIQSLVDSGQCRSGIIVSDVFHLADDANYKSLTSFLKSELPQLKRVRLTVPFYASTSPYKGLCENFKSRVPMYLRTRTSALPLLHLTANGPAAVGQWNQFDYTIFLPEVPEKRTITDFPKLKRDL